MSYEGNSEAYNRLLEKTKNLTGHSAEIAALLLKNKALFDKDNSGRWFYSVLYYSKPMEIVNAIGMENFLESLSKKEDVRTAVAAMIGEENTDLMDAVWKRITAYPYSKGYYRRSIRSQYYQYLYYGKCVEILLSFIADIANGFTVEAYLDSCRKPSRGDGVFVGESYTVPHIIAAVLDKGGAESESLLASLREIVIDDAGCATVTREIIEGLLKSSNPAAIQLVCDLLKAASLQEGLRQAILESVDEGSIPALTAILKLVIDENLMRFSSVVRAFCTWIGLSLDVTKLKKTQALFEAAYNCLTDEEAVNACLDDENGIKNNIALWTLSLCGIEKAEDKIRDIFQNGKRHQKLAALLFTSQIQFETLQYTLVRDFFMHPEDSKDRELMAWVLESLNSGSTLSIIPPGHNQLFYLNSASDLCITQEERVSLYLAMKKQADSFDAKNKKGFVFENSVIDGMSVTYTQDELLERMVWLSFRKDPNADTVYEESNEWDIPITIRLYKEPVALEADLLDSTAVGGLSLRDDLCLYADKMPVETRTKLLKTVIMGGTTERQRALMVASLGDRSRGNVLQAWAHMMHTPFTDDEIRTIEGFLRLKDGVIRQHILLKLLRQEPEKLGESIARLLSDKDKLRLSAGEELVRILATKKDDPRYAGIYAACTPLAAGKTEKSNAATEKTAAQKIEAPIYNRANGFGLYSPEEELPSFETPPISDKIPFAPNLERLQSFYKDINAVLVENKEYRYQSNDYGYTNDIVLGEDDRYFRPLIRATGETHKKRIPLDELTLEDYPLADEWRKIIREHRADDDFIFQAYLLPRLYADGFRSWVNFNAEGECDPQNDKLTPNSEYNKLLKQARELRAFILAMPYSYKTTAICPFFLSEFSEDAFLSRFHHFGHWLFNLKTDDPGQKSPAQHIKDTVQSKLSTFFSAVGFSTDSAGGMHSLLDTLENSSGRLFGSSPFMYGYIEMLEKRSRTDEQFTAFFTLVYEWYKKLHPYEAGADPFQIQNIVRAHGLGLLTDSASLRYILEAGKNEDRGKIRALSNPSAWQKMAPLSPAFEKIKDALIQRIAEIEIQRGDMVTETTAYASKIKYFEGARHFVSILERSGKDPFERNIFFSYSNGFTKKEMLSLLLRACHPAPGEGAAALRACLIGKKIPEQRLIDGAMFATQWLKPVAEYLGWDGLESACWYFHAHSSEHFSSEKETMVARFSAIEPKDFNDGAFDIEWFNATYNALGAERFAMAYDAAKYISSGSNHRRAQLFADAVTGKLDLQKTEAEVTEKRTKNYVLCYGLIPLGENKTADALHRYEVLQRFLKESRQFGAQRRESEGRAVQIALENLSRNAGYATPTRFVWSMEGEKIESVLRYFTPQTTEDVQIWLEWSDEGQSTVKVQKGDRELKSIPATLNKDPYVLEIKEVQKSLKEQHSRARLTLERAMESEERFERDELHKLASNPVIGPLLKKLIFKKGEKLGDLREILADEGNEGILIAHPVHLLASGKWSEYQHRLFEQQIQQPFKQVFRELYLPTEDELNTTVSDRYAGHQVQPAKGVGLLKSRGWTVHYEEGLQKVYHKKNLVVEIYAAADWFSPADVEAPTLETVHFYTCKEGTAVAIKDIDPVLFSEVMRDIDLMVSVAHVGGVDPEASHSTIEMRRAIAEEAVRLFRLDNVRFDGSRAFIRGSRAEYTVHLGSAQVYQMAQGALHVLAVPSQHRGRIFLPFVDEDPRTAEVISKILLFAEDAKIKDPSILSQLG